MRRIKAAAIAALPFWGLGLFATPPAAAQGYTAQEIQRPTAHHPPARIRVHALPPSYPGPQAVRQCTAWLEPEYRPSGTVIVPRMHCWWERG